MFQEGNYDLIKLQMPAQGMNQFVSPEVLPPSFAYYLENILPAPLGSGQVRNGTFKLNSLTDAEANILEAFLFVEDDGSEQAVLYVQSYTEDTSIEDAVVNSQTSLSFTSNDSPDAYVQDTPIKISYTLNGSNYTFYPKIVEVTVTDDVDVEIIIDQSYFPDSEGIEITNISYSVGQIYVYDYVQDTFSGILRNGLAVACIPRAAFFQKKLLICNGVDKVLYWDGDNLGEVVDFVKETKAQTFIRIDNNNFSFVSLTGFVGNKYFAGNLIELKIGGVTTQLTITVVNIVANLVTITTTEILPAFVEMIELFYQDWPPRFNYIFSGTDRLWALGPGAAGIQWRDADDALRVYYTYLPNTTTDWFNENTKTVPSIDLSKKHGIQDNLEAICQVNGLTAFVGRSRTQVWSGTIPGANGNLGDFVWQSNLDVGAIHGNLLIGIANDVYFISQSGLQSASTLNVAKQFATTSSNAVDPIINKYLESVMSSDIDYRSCRSFKYEQGNFGGFKIGRNKLLVSLFETNFYAWTFFSGYFQKSNTLLDSGDALCLFIGNSIHQYADGNNGSEVMYGDNDGNSLISFTWVPGLIKRGTKRYANKRYELIIGYPSSFPLDDSNKITLTVNGYVPRTFEVSDLCEFEEKGDTLGTVPFGDFRLGQDYNFVNKKLKFVSSLFWVRISGYTVNGPLSFKELKLFGIGERNG